MEDDADGIVRGSRRDPGVLLVRHTVSAGDKPRRRWRRAALVSLLVVGIVTGLVVRWHRARANSTLIAQLLNVDALPSDTRIMEIRKDIWTDTIVEAHLVIPAGTVEQLVNGIPLEACGSEPRKRYGIVMTKRWERHFSNADFTVECDETGTHVYVNCAVD